MQKIRLDWGASDAKRDAGLVTPPDVEREDNIQYGDDPVYQTLDVYRPRGAGVLPVIVNVHGGGWVYGTKEVYQYYCMSLCNGSGAALEGGRAGVFAVVNFNYRLAPEHPYPAALEDTASVFKWAEDNAARYKLDTRNIFAVGDSAGAHILSLYAATYKENKLRAVALNCGAYRGPKGDLAQAVCPQGDARRLNALRKIRNNFPPAFCMTATGDSLKSECAALFRTLIKAGVPCQCRLYGDAEHKLPHVFHVDIKRSEARECNKEEIEWFERWKTSR